MATAPESLHPAEHRAYRELYVACRQLSRRWNRLIKALADTEVAPALEEGRDEVERLTEELRSKIAARDLHAGPAAGGVAARFADARNLFVDRGADTGMVARFAVLDIEHIATLLSHLAELARARGDRDLAGFCERWSQTMRDRVDSVRNAAIALGADPDRTAAPTDDSVLSRAAHGVGWGFGAVGEAVDRATARVKR